MSDLRLGSPAQLGLTDHQWSVTRAALLEEDALRQHLVVSLSGAHAYGFPSPDSDIDLKAIHIAPTADLIGLAPRPGGRERLEIIDGVEIDFSSNELAGALSGVIGGNGNFAERFLSARPAAARPELDDLAPLIQRALSKRMYRHYHGFATSQKKAMDAGATASAKKVLYVLRTALTGVHLLLTGALVADLSQIADEHGFSDAHELIAAKTAGEKSALPEAVTERWRKRVGDAFQALDQALATSSLPDAPPNVAELEAWLIETRRRSLLG